MATGKIKTLYPPGNKGNRPGAGQIIDDATGAKYVFQTPDDVDPNVPLDAGMPVTFDITSGKSVGNVRLALPTCTLTSDVESVGVEGDVTLSWTSQNATSLSIDNGVGNVTPLASGSIVVNPDSSTTYTLTASNASGLTATASVDISVVLPIGGGGGTTHK
jgi:hypothetical protein